MRTAYAVGHLGECDLIALQSLRPVRVIRGGVVGDGLSRPKAIYSICFAVRNSFQLLVNCHYPHAEGCVSG